MTCIGPISKPWVPAAPKSLRTCAIYGGSRVPETSALHPIAMLDRQLLAHHRALAAVHLVEECDALFEDIGCLGNVVPERLLTYFFFYRRKHVVFGTFFRSGAQMVSSNGPYTARLHQDQEMVDKT